MSGSRWLLAAGFLAVSCQLSALSFMCPVIPSAVERPLWSLTGLVIFSLFRKEAAKPTLRAKAQAALRVRDFFEFMTSFSS